MVAIKIAAGRKYVESKNNLKLVMDYGGKYTVQNCYEWKRGTLEKWQHSRGV